MFGRSVKNFRRPGQFLKVWKKLEMSGKKFRKKCMEKIQGVKNFGNEGEERFREILSCLPQNACCPSNAPPQIPRPGAATVYYIPSSWKRMFLL